MLDLKTIRNNIMQLIIQYTIFKVENNGDLIRFNIIRS